MLVFEVGRGLIKF